LSGHGSEYITSPLDQRDHEAPHIFNATSISDPLQPDIGSTELTSTVCNDIETSHYSPITSAQNKDHFDANDCALGKRSLSLESHCLNMELKKHSLFNQARINMSTASLQTLGLDNNQHATGCSNDSPLANQNYFDRHMYRKESICQSVIPGLDSQRCPLIDELSVTGSPYPTDLIHYPDNSGLLPEQSASEPFPSSFLEESNFRNDLDFSMPPIFNNSPLEPFSGPTATYDSFLQTNTYFESCGMYR